MSAATTSTITAADWLDIRDHVAKEVKTATTGTRAETCVNIAERLLRNGFIDIDAVLEKTHSSPAALAAEQSHHEPKGNK